YDAFKQTYHNSFRAVLAGFKSECILFASRLRKIWLADFGERYGNESPMELRFQCHPRNASRTNRFHIRRDKLINLPYSGHRPSYDAFKQTYHNSFRAVLAGFKSERCSLTSRLRRVWLPDFGERYGNESPMELRFQCHPRNASRTNRFHIRRDKFINLPYSGHRPSCDASTQA